MTDLSNPLVRVQHLAEYMRASLDLDLGVEGLKRLYVKGSIDVEEFEDRVARVLEHELNE